MGYDGTPCPTGGVVALSEDLLGGGNGMCLPKCSSSDTSCPADVPSGITAQPKCALIGSLGLCLLTCTSDSQCDVKNSMRCVGKDNGAGSCAYDLNYYVKSVSGRWKHISYSSGPQSVSIAVGTTHSYTVSDTHKWAVSASAKTGLGFTFLDVAGLKGPEVSAQASYEYTVQHTDIFTETKTITKTYQFPAGTVWQFELVVENLGGSTVMRPTDFAQTDGDFDNPCCLPGYASDPSQQHGPCKAGPDGKVFDVCKAENAMVLV